MITLEKVDGATLEAEAEKAGITLPIEQTKVWSGFQADIDGRTPWGDYLIKRDGELVAVISFIDFETHGYHYLRSMHGPAWVAKPTEAEEREVVDAIVDTVKKADKSIAFLRIDTWFADGTEKVLSTVPYDQTVVIDITGGDDEILARMKRRGRRDVRKSLRECPAEVADETDKALTDFSEYYDVMVETGQRDGFTPAPMSDYSDMIGALGADHCRVFAARIEDRVVAWSIVTVNGTHAVRYYAGMRNEVMRLHVTDKLLYSECCILGSQGITEYDLMGIGSDFAPSLKGLNEFKCKFTEEITPVAPPATYPSRRSSTRRCRLCRACARHYANTTPLPLVGAVERSETEGGLSRWTTLCHLWRQFLPAGTIHLSFEFLAHHGCYAVGSHGYAVERVGNRHGALLVSNNDELRMGA